ncbi:MAG: DNA translocase FtsK [Candidatus Andersenbacteria bacterium]|nr:DNA translocase FtsK [bacterium]MDZ4225292.1 DNA translocase FtsK [Candidatus Andersenbacteria bacterium]
MGLNPFRRKKHSQRGGQTLRQTGWLRPETKQAVVGVILLLLAVIIVLSFFNQAGKVGVALLIALRQLVGWLAYPTPFLMMYIGYRLLRPGREPLAKLRIVGAALAVVGLLAVFHLLGVSTDDALQVAYEGKGGGFLGFMLSYPLSLAMSSLVSLLIYGAALVVGLLITFDLSPTDIVGWLGWFRLRRNTAEEGDEDVVPPTLPHFRISHMAHPAPADSNQLHLDDKQAKREKQQDDLRRQQLRAANKRYNAFPLEILSSSSLQPEGGDVENNKSIIESTLSNFNITVTMGKAKVGPTVTQYTLRPDEGVRLSQITALQNDLARALMAHPVRIEAPIPNTDLVGVEIPNKKVALVRLRDLLGSKEMRRMESPLTFALGKDVSGEVITGELDRMPHLLIAGATNSGKSVCIHSILMSLMHRNSPALLRLVLVDPKRVELTAYNGIPHLWGNRVIVDTGQTLNALKWALGEMDKRYKKLEESGSRNLLSYNINNPDSALPFIVIVIDELADLMAKHARDVEGPVVRLSQLARAVGIHLVLATQRPSVNVITGLIKANIPTRIAFKVASQVDSRTILDIAGAEKLLGTGDMLYMAADNTKPKRLQGGYVSEEEVREAVKYVVENNEAPEYEEEESIIMPESGVDYGGVVGGDDDALLNEAKRLALDARKISASLLQRRLRVGYARAARLLDTLQEQGVIGQAEGNKPREVLVGANEIEYVPREAVPMPTLAPKREDNHREEDVW